LPAQLTVSWLPVPPPRSWLQEVGHVFAGGLKTLTGFWRKRSEQRTQVA
jgi:hypothetical protein